MATPLATLFAHNTWANLRLLDRCQELEASALELSAPGTYGAVLPTLVHLVAAEERYLARFRGEDRAAPRPEDQQPLPTLAELRERAIQAGEGLQAEAAASGAGRAVLGTWAGKPMAHRAEVLLIQAINHSTEHRGHVVSILNQNGIETPGLDGWAYEAVLGMP